MTDLSKISDAEQLDAEEMNLKAELRAILDLPYFERERHRMRLTSIHYCLGYIEWVRAGKPEPQPRFV